MINNSGLARALALLAADITHIAVGTGAAPAVSATLLTAELDRNPVGTNENDGYVQILEAFFDTGEANGTITEVGAFCNGATDTANTGELYGSSAANITKDSTMSLTVSIEIGVEEVTI